MKPIFQFLPNFLPNFLSIFQSILFLFCVLFLMQSCKSNPFSGEARWIFSAIPATDSASVPRTIVSCSINRKNYSIDTFCGTFAALPRYLQREDLPDSTIAVCRGQWLGAPKWLCATMQNGKPVFYEADEDNGYYNDDENELPLAFRKFR